MATAFHACTSARVARLGTGAARTARAAALILLAGLSLAGCAAKPLTETAGMAAEPARTGPAKLVEVTPAGPHASLKGKAVLLLPEDTAPIKAIRERHHTNGTRQEIVLDTARQGAGEGVIDVSVQTAPARDGRATDLQLYKPTEDNIRNEIIGRFPDVKMNFVTRAYTNGFGKLGIAIGRHPSGATCVFSWQWIDDLRSTGSGNPASVRIRLCRRDQTADQIVAKIEQLRLGNEALQRLTQMDRSRADGSVQPIDGAGAPVASSGPLRPVEGSLESMLPKSKQAPQAATADASARPAAGATRRIVRAKPREQDWRNQTAANERAPLSERLRRQPPRTGRFLAPVPANQVQPAQMPAEANPASTAQTALSAQSLRPGADLPAEAFRGPVRTQAQPSPR